MGLVVEFRLHFVPRPAGAPGVFRFRVLRQRVAALDHETLHDAMKRRAVVESLGGKGLEIFNGFRRDVRPEFNHHLARRGFDDGHFVGAHNNFGLRLDYLIESAGTILMLSRVTRGLGMLISPIAFGPVQGESPSFPSTSSPLITLPKAVYW